MFSLIFQEKSIILTHLSSSKDALLYCHATENIPNIGVDLCEMSFQTFKFFTFIKVEGLSYQMIIKNLVIDYCVMFVRKLGKTVKNSVTLL
jgi:hypothetical protein